MKIEVMSISSTQHVFSSNAITIWQYALLINVRYAHIFIPKIVLYHFLMTTDIHPFV